MRYSLPAALVAALALAALASPAHAASLHIALAGESSPGNLDIFTVTPSGQGRQKVTSGPADDTLPAFSPARDLIVFTRTPANKPRRLAVVQPSGAGLKVIPNTTGGGAPSWSPDGALIAFDSAGSIRTIKSNGTGLTQLTQGPGDSYPEWSPDSKFIVFQRQGALWRMGADGNNLKKLTNKGMQPAWRPNGKHIAFVRKSGGKLALFIMKPNGSQVTQLAPKGQRPAWEPNSRHVAFATGGGASKIKSLLIGGAVPAQPVNVTPGITPAW